MKLPRDLSGRDLAKALRKLGYGITRQTGSHIRVTTHRRGEHHVTIPDHDALRVGTMAGLLLAIGRHHGIDREELIRLLFGGK